MGFGYWYFCLSSFSFSFLAGVGRTGLAVGRLNIGETEFIVCWGSAAGKLMYHTCPSDCLARPNLQK